MQAFEQGKLQRFNKNAIKAPIAVDLRHIYYVRHFGAPSGSTTTLATSCAWLPWLPLKRSLTDESLEDTDASCVFPALAPPHRLPRNRWVSSKSSSIRSRIAIRWYPLSLNSRPGPALSPQVVPEPPPERRPIGGRSGHAWQSKDEAHR